MRTQAKLVEDITTLTAEVAEFSRRQGRALPTPEEWVDVIEARGDLTLEKLRALAEPGEDQNQRLTALLVPGEVAPACEALKGAYLLALGAGMAKDRPAYESGLRALRPILREVLARKATDWAKAWPQASRSFDLYREARYWLAGVKAPPLPGSGGAESGAEWAAQTVAKAKGWHLVVLAARALGLAERELQPAPEAEASETTAATAESTPRSELP